MHKFRCVALVLKSVVKERITHAHKTPLISAIELVSELLVPHPVIRLAGLHDLVFQQLVNNVDVVNNVQDQGLHLDKDQIIATVVE